MENAENCGTGCKCHCHKFVGIFVFLIGLTFLLGALEVLTQKTVSMTWPVLVMLAGLKKSFGSNMCKCCGKK